MYLRVCVRAHGGGSEVSCARSERTHKCWKHIARVMFFLIVSDVLFLGRLMLEVQVTQSPHIEFHLKWAEGVLLNHGSHIMAERAMFTASLRALHMGFSKQFGGMCKMPKRLIRCGLLHCVWVRARTAATARRLVL